MTEDKQLILVVISDDGMRSILIDAFQEYGCPFSYKGTSSIEEALKVLSQDTVHAIVMTKSEALSGNDGVNGLITSRSQLPPTITIIQQGDGFPYYLYPPYENNDWVTTPFDLQELYGRISGVIHRANK